MSLPFFLIIFIFILIWFQIKMRTGTKNYEKSFEKYFQAERDANFVRRKEIPEEAFIKIDERSLPFREYPESSEYDKIKERQAAVKIKLQRPMLHFDKPMSNLEVKMNFGTSQLENIILYEETFNLLMRNLLEWAEELKNLNNNSDCEKVLEAAVNFGCDLSRVYIMLADLYHEDRLLEKLAEFREHLNRPDVLAHDEDTKNRVILYIEKLKQSY